MLHCEQHKCAHLQVWCGGVSVARNHDTVDGGWCGHIQLVAVPGTRGRILHKGPFSRQECVPEHLALHLTG